MSRKDTLRALLTTRERKLPDGNPSTTPEDETGVGIDVARHVRSGAVGAMGRSLGKITHAAEEERVGVLALRLVVLAHAGGETVAHAVSVYVDPGRYNCRHRGRFKKGGVGPGPGRFTGT